MSFNDPQYTMQNIHAKMQQETLQRERRNTLEALILKEIKELKNMAINGNSTKFMTLLEHIHPQYKGNQKEFTKDYQECLNECLLETAAKASNTQEETEDQTYNPYFEIFKYIVDKETAIKRSFITTETLHEIISKCVELNSFQEIPYLIRSSSRKLFDQKIITDILDMIEEKNPPLEAWIIKYQLLFSDQIIYD